MITPPATGKPRYVCCLRKVPGGRWMWDIRVRTTHRIVAQGLRLYTSAHGARLGATSVFLSLADPRFTTYTPAPEPKPIEKLPPTVRVHRIR